jgi:hypothetical protein
MSLKSKTKTAYAFLTALLLVSATACSMDGIGGASKNDRQAAQETGFMPASPGNYDSADTAAVVDIDTDKGNISFLNFDTGRRYTLGFDGATLFKDKFGEGIALSQIETGDIADVTFMHARKRLNSLEISDASFELEIPDGFKTEGNGKKFRFRGKDYDLFENVAIILPAGRGELEDINEADQVKAFGIGHDIYAIKVVKSHGYLRLENTAAFEGGFIGIGDGYVKQIEKDMLLTIPEGVHEVFVSKAGVTGTETVNVAAGNEATLDLSRFQATPMYGGILFATSPAGASIYIDGDKKDISEEVSLSYGLHQMVAAAEGYETLSRYIRVAEPHASLSVELAKKEDGGSVSEDRPTENTGAAVSADSVSSDGVSGNAVSGNGLSGNTAQANASVSGNEPTVPAMPTMPATPLKKDEVTPGEYRVRIEEPSGAEVYKDGNYLGIAPISFKKSPGTYIITLRRNGYQTRSYTISVDNEEKDASFSFSELVELED